jgi:hypothetical protein
MAFSETSSVGTPPILASSAVTASISTVLPVMSPGAWTWMLVCPVVRLVNWVIWACESSGLIPPKSALTSATVAVVGTCQTTPPLKSMLKFRPLTPRATMPTAIMVPDRANQYRHRLMKS